MCSLQEIKVPCKTENVFKEHRPKQSFIHLFMYITKIITPKAKIKIYSIT